MRVRVESWDEQAVRARCGRAAVLIDLRSNHRRPVWTCSLCVQTLAGESCPHIEALAATTADTQIKEKDQ